MGDFQRGLYDHSPRPSTFAIMGGFVLRHLGAGLFLGLGLYVGFVWIPSLL